MRPASAPAPRPAEPCHDVGEFLRQPFELQIALVAAFSRCEGAERVFRVAVDHRYVGSVHVPCADVTGVRAPPPSYDVQAVRVNAGAHLVTVTEPATHRSAQSSIVVPALLVTDDGRGIFAGAHVAIRADDAGFEVEPPTVLSGKAL